MAIFVGILAIVSPFSLTSNPLTTSLMTTSTDSSMFLLPLALSFSRSSLVMLISPLCLSKWINSISWSGSLKVLSEAHSLTTSALSSIGTFVENSMS